MRLFIADRIGTGTRADPFRPDVDVVAVGGKCGQIQITANRYLCVAPNATAAPQGTVDLDQFPLERLSGQRLNRIANALGVNSADIADMTLGEILLTRLPNLVPTRQSESNRLVGPMRWKITVAGVDLHDAPVIAGGATDSFTYSNGLLATVASGVWSTQTGAANQFTVSSNTIVNTGSSGFHANRYVTTFATDHYSQIVVTTNPGEMGVMCRMQSGDLSGFYAMIHNTGLAELHRVDNGTFNLIDSATSQPTTPTIRLEVIGSSITEYLNGSNVNSATDTAYPSNTSCGIAGDLASGLVADNWDGGAFSTLEQEGFRWRNDDGSETAATWKASQDSDVTAPLSANIRLRTLANATGDPTATAYTLYYKKSTDSTYIKVPVGSGPPFPVVEATAESSTNTAGTSHTVTLPSGITSTDKVLIFMDIGSTSATLNALTDWTEHLDENSANGLKILEYTGTGVPSNPTFTSSASTRDASISLRISGADRATAPTLAASTGTGTSATPDPPSVSPPSTKNYLVIAFYGAAGEEADDDTWSDTPPTNYGPTPPLQKACGTAGTNLGGMIALAYRQLNTGSAEDPGTFGKDVSAAWRAQTVLVHPVGNPPVYVSTSANVTAGGEATTVQLTAPSGKSTSDFVTGRMWDDENGTDTIDVTADDYTELEWSLQAQSPAADADVYQFRTYAGSTEFATYTVTPQWTIGSGAITGTVAVTLGAFTSTATGSTTSGSAAITLAAFTTTTAGSTASATAAITMAPFTSTASGTSDSPNVDGTSARTLAPFTTTTTGTYTPPPVTGTAAVTLGAFTSTATGVFSTTLYPASIDHTNRKLLDQNGNVYVMRTFSSWGLGTQLSNTDITTWLEGVASRGFNAVTVWMGGAAFNGTGWNQYTNQGGQNLWSGTAFQLADTNPSSLGAGWSSIDHIVSEADRLGLVVNLSLSYIGVQLSDNRWTNASNTQMSNTGGAIANRYAAYQNICWHVMFDWAVDPGGTAGVRLDNFFAGINTAEGASTRPVRWCEVNQPATTNGDGWYMTGNIDFSVNCWYNNDQTDVNESTEIVEATWAETLSPVAPIGDCEPPYDGNSHYANHGGNETLGLRYRSYASVIEGAAIFQYGHEDAWPFGASNGAGSEGLTWDEVIDDVHTIQQSYVWALVDEHMLTTDFQPTSAFVTTGEGTTTSKAAQGASATKALAYFPNNRTVQVDTTIISGTGPVRLRWYDPTAGTYSNIATSEAQQTGRSVTLPAAHSDGQRDWVLVVDAVNDVTGTVAVTLASFTSSASGTSTPPAFTGTSAQTLAAFTTSTSGTHTPPAFTGTSAQTLAAFTSSASGTATPPPISGTVAVTLGAFTDSASGTFVPSGSGFVAVTLAPFTTSTSGTSTPPPITGTAAVTMAVFTTTTSGSVTAPGFTGTVAVTLAAFLPSADGTSFPPPPVTGTADILLEPFVAAGGDIDVIGLATSILATAAATSSLRAARATSTVSPEV